MSFDSDSVTDSVTVPTAKAAREEAARLGLEGDALEVYVQAGAPARHRARVEAARKVMEAVFPVRLEGDGLYDDLTLRAALGRAFVGLLDAVGVGGTRGTGRGSGTSRYPALRVLGKGRKQASDGEAWTSAIESAARVRGVLRYGYNTEGEVYPVGVTVFGAVATNTVGLSLLVRPDGEDLILTFDAGLVHPSAVLSRSGRVRASDVDAEWLETLCRRVIFDAGAKDAGEYPEALPDAMACGSLADWGALLNATAERRKAAVKDFAAQVVEESRSGMRW